MPPKEPKTDAEIRRIAKDVVGRQPRATAEQYEVQQELKSRLESLFGESRKMDVGSVNVPWSVTQLGSDNVDVAHDLGVVPLAVVAVANDVATGAGYAWVVVGNFTTTHFRVNAQRNVATAAGTGAVTVYWIAVG